MQTIEGQIVDIHDREIFQGSIVVDNGYIRQILRHDTDVASYIMPGFVDSHIHIESSMLTPYNFAALASKFGTVAVVSDPHEITNVCGCNGIEFMVDDTENAAVKIFFSLPSSVPASDFETSGASIDAVMTEKLLGSGKFVALSEMMNYPGVVNGDSEVMAKIEAAHKYGIPIDGHSPLLGGESLNRYVAAGITTDHEVTSMSEALEKIKAGMIVQIREGSSAKSLTELLPLLGMYPDRVMFCRDDWKVADLVRNGHIDSMVRRAVNSGYDLFDTLRAASLNPIVHYNLPVGMLRVGDKADFVIVDNLRDLNVMQTFLDGEAVSDMPVKSYPVPINNFMRQPVCETDIAVSIPENVNVKVIGVTDGDIITTAEEYIYDTDYFHENDIHKIVCISRYDQDAKIAVGFVHGFGLTVGAMASTVAHDSHNIVAVGTDDRYIVKAVNEVIQCKGGVAVVTHDEYSVTPLPIAGIISNMNAEKLLPCITETENVAKRLSRKLTSPFMTLSFMALSVIPHLKITDKGLFDSDAFHYVPLFNKTGIK